MPAADFSRWAPVAIKQQHPGGRAQPRRSAVDTRALAQQLTHAPSSTLPYRLLNGSRYWAHRVIVGEDEQAGRVRRHDDHDQVPPRNRCLAGAVSVVMVTVAVGRDLLGPNRFRTV